MQKKAPRSRHGTAGREPHGSRAKKEPVAKRARAARHKWTRAETRGILESLLHVTKAGSTDRPSEADVHEHYVGVTRSTFKPSATQVGNKIKSLRKAYGDNNTSVVGEEDRMKYRSCLAARSELSRE